VVDVSYTLHEVTFKWDERKARSNLHKHRVSFEEACEVFFDPFVRVADAGGVESEPRAAVIGMTMNWRLLLVVYIELDDVIRIVSARPVERSERRSYEDQQA
jgi:uncharacterized DUF497 family protein